MAWFLWTLGALLLFSALASESLIRLKVEKQDNRLHHLTIYHTDSSPTAIFGDSHGAVDLQPKEGVVNLAYVRESIEVIAMKIRLLLDRRPLKRIILQADPSMFGPYRLDAVADVEAFRHLDQGGFNTSFFTLRIVLDQHRPQILNYWRVWFEVGSFQKPILRLHPGGWLEMRRQWLEMPAPRRKQETLARIALQRPPAHFADHRFTSIYTQLLTELIDVRHIPVCLIGFPMSPDYLAEMGPSFDLVQSWFQKTALAHGAAYFNYVDLYGEQPHLFADQDHLNKDGAAIFSERVFHDCGVD
ncbi:MAG: hypothetical protein HQL52_08015 [Magnetococcales bacterium]|nr:hypothetical protein [Magnetococcales bacterium]